MNSKAVVLLLIGAVLGFMIVNQIKVQSKLAGSTDPKKVSTVALEVAEGIKGNKKLREELTNLEKQKKEIEAASTDKASIDESYQKELNQLKIIAGESSIVGPGVTIKFEKSLQISQLVDLVNALRNIGIEALSINGSRVIMDTSITDKIATAPIEIIAIGDNRILYDSLLRRGGIIEQIESTGKVSQSDNLEVPSVKNSN